MDKVVYCSGVVKKLQEFYGDLLTRLEEFATIADHLDAIASRMWEGIQNQNPAVYSEMSNYHPDFLGKSMIQLQNVNLTLKDCRTCIAAEYGFSSWDNLLTQGNVPYNIDFEVTVNAMLNGDLLSLKKNLERNPAIVNQYSQYGHRASLLHYAVANGVEFWRQQTPFNLPEIVQYLIEKKANCLHKMHVYGGHFTPIELLDSSAHPRNAGVLDQLKRILEP